MRFQEVSSCWCRQGVSRTGALAYHLPHKDARGCPPTRGPLAGCRQQRVLVHQ